MTVEDKLADLIVGIAAKRRNEDAAKAAAEAAKAKARDDIAKATTLPELKSALLRYLA